MNYLVLLFWASFFPFSINALGESGLKPANDYACTGGNGMSVSYSSSKKLFSVTIGGKKINWMDKKFSVLSTRIGTLLTGNAPGPASMIDGPSFDYTLVAPKVNLPNVGSTQEFNSLLVRTTVPSPYMSQEGVVQDNDWFDLECKASYK